MKMLQKIEKQTASMVREIQRAAQKEQDAIIAQAEQAAKELARSLSEHGKKQAEREKTRILARATGQANRERLDHSDVLLAQVREQVEQGITSLTQDKRYAGVLNKLVQEGMEGLPGDIVVHVNPRDKTKVKIKESRVKLAASPAVVAGAVIQAKNGNAKIDNSIAAIFRQRWPELRAVAQKELMRT